MKTLKFGEYEYDLDDDGRILRARYEDGRHAPAHEVVRSLEFVEALRRIAALEAELASTGTPEPLDDAPIEAWTVTMTDPNYEPLTGAVPGTLRTDNLPIESPATRWLRDEDCVYRLGVRGYNMDTISVSQAGNKKTAGPRAELAERIQMLLNGDLK